MNGKRVVFCKSCKRLKVVDGWQEIKLRKLTALIKDKKNTVQATMCSICEREKRLERLAIASRACSVVGEEW